MSPAPPLLAELVDGVVHRPKGVPTTATLNPATGEVLALAPVADGARVEQAIAAARAAYHDRRWVGLSPAVRAQALRGLADELEANLEAFAQAETADTGMTLKMTRQGHIPRSVAHLRFFAGECERLQGESVAMEDAYVQLIEREALGVVGILAPWNAPLAVATINLGAALAMGNSVVLKSSERAPYTLSLLAELVAELDFPAGVINILHGPGDPTGTAMAESPHLDGLCFVGGTDTARSIAARSNHPFRRNTLELGGKSATLIMRDANLEEALDGALLSVFSSNGEVCTSGSRLLVHRSIYRDFVDAFVERTQRIVVGDPLNEATELGPLIDAAHQRDVERHIHTAIEQGAKLRSGGKRPPGLKQGFYLSPCVLEGVMPHMDVFRQEVFGPVAAFTAFDDEKDAIELANDTAYGLAATIWCGDTGAGIALARRMRCGVVGVNSPVIRDLRVPFGGRGASGLGRVGGRWSLEQYSELKTTCLRVKGYPLPRYGMLDAP